MSKGEQYQNFNFNLVFFAREHIHLTHNANFVLHKLKHPLGVFYIYLHIVELRWVGKKDNL